MVPKGWEKRDLHGLITIKHGFAFKSEYFSNDGKYVLLTPGSFNESGGFRNQGPKTKFYNGPIPNGYLLSKGDLLLAMTEQAEGLLGSPLFVPEDNKYLHNQRLGLVEINCPDKICSDFLYLFFNHEDSRKQITEQSTGTKVKHTSPDRLCSVIGLVPSFLEQKKIAQTLSTWDKAISMTENLLTNSQQQKKALMQQLLTGNKRLLDENGVRFNGKWEKKHLSDVADVYQPKTISQSMMSDSGYPVYGANGVIGFYHEFNHETEQIAVTCRGSTCGIVNWTQAKSWITGNAMVINTDNYSYVSKKFLFYTLNGSDLKYLISGSGQPQITGNIKTHIINLPCIEEQQKIATVLSAADAEISTLEKKIACLKDEKKALMQQLLTGKRRVKVDEAVAA
ncbi:restriction endonuclease subunit S [Raoultella ornithinolytica]|uniref:restriction endonuclease subunit S n=2 Tax=Raoultella TaxID=160674 RepID=UPI001A1AFFCD|nr:restriction endonuclease subunit S [Raoultella ornithinolytica]HAT2556733.1 restriction endonuclease subunit S [Raoultella ornithinolytica]HEP0605613.1 restriction endonuclease subunit S [Raoultella ornithinolytica]